MGISYGFQAGRVTMLSLWEQPFPVGLLGLEPRVASLQWFMV